MQNPTSNYLMFILFLAAFLSTTACTNDTTKSSNEAELLIEHNQKIAADLISIWESGDTAKVNSLFHPLGTYVDMPNNHTFEGIAGAQAYINHVHTWGTNINMEIRSKHISYNNGYIEWTFSGIQSSPIPGRVPIATNKAVTFNGVTLFEFKDDKVFKATDYLDAFGFVLQLGSKVELPGGVVIGGE